MKYPYSLSGAIGYSIVLLVSLWWIPVVGPMIIGYITGRKAGGPVKGILAMMVPIALYFLILQGITMGWVHVPHIVSGYFGTPASVVLVPYLQETITTGINVGISIEKYLYYVPPAFFIMLSFAFIGGAMSRLVILEKGIYPERNLSRLVPKRKKSINVPETHSGHKKEKLTSTSTNKKKSVKGNKKIKDISRDGKFVVHEMDTKKVTPVKKKYGITFL